MKMRIAGTKAHSLVDGEGIRYVVFFQGCAHNCKGCHNPDTHDFDSGYEADAEALLEDIRGTKHIDGVTFSGGDPMYQSKAMMYLAERIHGMGLTVWCYTGFVCEELPDEWLEHIDVLVDGPFIEELKENALPYTGSSNQRVITLR